MNQAQSTKLQLFGPRSLGLCAKEKGTLKKFHLHHQRKMMKKSETGLGGREGAMIGTYKNIVIDFYVRIFFQKINFHLLITQLIENF